MTEWAATDNQICGFGDNTSVTLETEGWEPGGHPPALAAAVDAAAVGTALAIRLPAGEATLRSDDERPLPAGSLPAAMHRVVVDAPLETHVAFDGPATVDPAGSGAWIQFPEETAVVVGFRETPTPRPTVTVPATPAGLATAVTAAGRTHRTSSPERSHPGYRPRTPRVAFGERSIPEELAPDESAPTMTVPNSAAAVLVAAPLAYYLGAALRVREGLPTLEGPGISHTFDPLPALAEEVADALQTLVALDGRLRSVPGERDAGLERHEPLRSASPTRRLSAALEWHPDELPQWPLSTYIDDDPENGRYLPYLLDRLSLVHPACASSLDPKALLKRSLDEFYRGETPNVEAVDPALAGSRFHAWLGEGTPVDAYTLLGSVDSPPTSGDRVRIDVVCNEPEMEAERNVAEVYRSRLCDRADVRVHERLSRRELAEVFEREADLVHFIGHCEADGIVCSDGVLAAADLQSCGARAFFLNACGSYYEGYDLVRRGARVGAVTLTAVLDEQAMTLGTTFAELLTAGFAFNRALALARGEIIVGQDYVVIGDGTHRLRPPRGTPAVCHLSDSGENYTVRYEALAPDSAGRRYVDPFEGAEHPCGRSATATLTPDELRAFLERFSLPVRYDGELRWSGELTQNIAKAGQRN